MRIKSLILPVGYILLGAALTAVAMLVTEQHQTVSNIPGVSTTTVPTKPPLTDYGYPHSEKSLFGFSPNNDHIAFIEDVFNEYGRDYGRYYAIRIFDVEARQEKTVLVGDIKLSSFEWLDNNTLRAYLNAGTGVRAYRDISIGRLEPLIYKDYIASGKEAHTFWTPDEEYVQELQRKKQASMTYLELTRD